MSSKFEMAFRAGRKYQVWLRGAPQPIEIKVTTTWYSDGIVEGTQGGGKVLIDLDEVVAVAEC